MKTTKPITLQILGAICLLSIGVLVYLFDRQPDAVYFLAPWMSQDNDVQPVFATLGFHLPTFVHVYAFILLTALLVKPSRSNTFFICLFWFGIESLFEIAQANVPAQWIARNVPAWFQGVPFLENTSHYFLSGTFDPVDLASIAAGTIAAYLTIIISTRRNLPHVSAS